MINGSYFILCFHRLILLGLNGLKVILYGLRYIYQLSKRGWCPVCSNSAVDPGAENKWFGEELPDGVDDGFLTAWEIANLNFCDLELVVLSACETARGDVESDGVFGLQRGFKMSSAGSILMSLWKVDDEATCLLMTEFYKHWMGGSTKHDALKKAQSVVRSHIDKGWDSPRYWASFILLDAVDALL